MSKCLTEQDFEINVQCLTSLFESEKLITFHVTIIESNAAFQETGFVYKHNNVNVVIRKDSFNYNRYLNHGLQLTQNKWIVISNNDVIYHPNWFTEILLVKSKHPEINSFCPFDRTSPYLAWGKYNLQSFHCGYRVPIELVGWCIVIERRVLQTIGVLDERFDLYFQDNDFAETLRHHRIGHALVSNSFVQHVGGYTTGVSDASITEKFQHDKLLFESKWRSGFLNKLTRLFR